MERFVKGNVVIIPFPFSDLSDSKKTTGISFSWFAGKRYYSLSDNFSKFWDYFSINLDSSDFENGSLPVNSLIRPNRIFTADKNIINRKVGKISNEKLNSVYNALNNLFSL